MMVTQSVVLIGILAASAQVSAVAVSADGDSSAKRKIVIKVDNGRVVKETRLAAANKKDDAKTPKSDKEAKKKPNKVKPDKGEKPTDAAARVQAAREAHEKRVAESKARAEAARKEHEAGVKKQREEQAQRIAQAKARAEEARKAFEANVKKRREEQAKRIAAAKAKVEEARKKREQAREKPADGPSRKPSSKEEKSDPDNKLFERFDRNGDGRLDRKEAQSLIDSLRRGS